MRKIYIIIIGLLSIGKLYGQSPATVKEYLKEYKTYPFADPDPIPSTGSIYPYFRYDGFTNTAIQKKWKIIELENDYIKVDIMPEIGGKIWAAIDKQTGKSFIYENHVVKFRDIAMRGPWTSGGIEPNYGLIGHTPNCAAPVDYLTKINNDGSVSCFISVLDRLSNTRWNLEINLPADKCYFITRSFWHNDNSTMQPYYSWMNAAVPVNQHLKFLYPGNKYIGHNGEANAWPLDTIRNKDLSYYAQNNFNASKSYHVTGTNSKYFGVYYTDSDYGMVHFANREDKLGKKLFLWAQSDDGKLWEKLLTDNDGQYAEVQSGRLFNQNFYESSFTPFKQLTFLPYQSDTWTEYWYPFKQTKGISEANLTGVIHAEQNGQLLSLEISPAGYLNDTLKVYGDSNNLLYIQAVNLKPLKPYHQSISLKPNMIARSLVLNGEQISIHNEKEKDLERPVKLKPDFDQESGYGLYLQGRELVRYKNYAEGELKIQQSLAKDGSFIPAIIEMAGIQYHKMKYDSAFTYAKTALSIDEYDPAANYYYGISAAHLNKWNDALDGLEVASLNPSYSCAAYTELSKMYIRKNDFEKGYEYAAKSLINNTQNITGLQLQYLAARCLNKNTSEIKERILELDPLNHFIRFEAYSHQQDSTNKNAFLRYIRDEMPQETFLNLVVWYYNIGRMKEARMLLQMSPQTSEILFWRAYLNSDSTAGKALLSEANKSSAYLVFPYLEESATVMQWAMQQNQDWKPAYYLALINNYRNNKPEARRLLGEIKDATINFAPLYAFKSSLSENPDSTLQYLIKATKAGPDEWRYGNSLAEFYIRLKKYDQALSVIAPYHQAHPENYITGIIYIRCLMLNDRFIEAERELSKIEILPYEDATYSRSLYKETKLMLANISLENKRYKQTLQKIEESKLWPLKLGVGKPYDNLIDLSMELWLEAAVHKAMGNEKKANECYQLINAATYPASAIASLIKSCALKQLGDVEKGKADLNSWLQLQTDPKLIEQAKLLFYQNKEFNNLLKSISQKEDKRLF